MLFCHSTKRFGQRACPEFVIERLSPSDRPKVTRAKMRAKMRDWIGEGPVAGFVLNLRDIWAI